MVSGRSGSDLSRALLKMLPFALSSRLVRRSAASWDRAGRTMTVTYARSHGTAGNVLERETIRLTIK